MNEFLPQDLALACHSAGLLTGPDGAYTSQMAEIVEEAGPVLAGRDRTDLALLTEVRLAAGALLETLSDDEVTRLLPYIRREYDRQKIPTDVE